MNWTRLWILTIALVVIAADRSAALAQGEKLPLRPLEFAPPDINMILCHDVAWIRGSFDNTMNYPPTRSARNHLARELEKISVHFSGSEATFKAKNLVYFCSFKRRDSSKRVNVLEFDIILPPWLQAKIRTKPEIAVLVERDGRHLLVFSQEPGYARRASQQKATVMEQTQLPKDMRDIVLGLASKRFWTVKEMNELTYRRLHELSGHRSGPPGPEFVELRFFTTSADELGPNSVSVDLGFHYSTNEKAKEHRATLRKRLPFPREKKSDPVVDGAAVRVTIMGLSFAKLAKLVRKL